MPKEDRVRAGDGDGDGAALALTADGLQQRSECPRILHSLVQAHRAVEEIERKGQARVDVALEIT